jgi:DNA repair exonuclease SbcCD nuclease subunit
LAALRFLHTADWQIGKPFRQFGEREAILKRARLEAIEAIGRLAVAEGVRHVLVAGDVYDSEAPAPQTLREPLERMRGFPGVAWHLVPGNHDPHRPKGVWDRVAAAGVPENVHLHLVPQPVAIEDGAVLLPAVLTRKAESGDLTAWMDGAESPPGAIRLGLAHGSVVGFDSEGEAGNPVDPRRPESAGLSYLALGDWHRTLRIGPACWYAGTPEPDRAGSQEVGRALLVTLAGAGAPAVVEEREVGGFRWTTREEVLGDAEALADLEARLRALPRLASTVLRLRLSGALPIAARAELDRRLAGLAAALFRLDVDDGALSVRPTAADLEAIDFGGVLRQAADRLRGLAEDAAAPADQRRRAENALVELYLMAAGGERGA